MLEQFVWLRDWILCSFFLDMPPMRPQNAVLEILTQEESIGSRQHNGILFFAKSIRLQIVHFKNSQYVGEKIVIIPQQLEQKLRLYMEMIRPIFGISLYFCH